MNNSFFSQEALRQPKDKPEAVGEREAYLVRVIDGIKKVVESESWSSLKTLLFDPKEAELKKLIFLEARSDKADLLKLAKLNGRYEEARRVADLKEYASQLQQELNNLRKHYGQTPETQ